MGVTVKRKHCISLHIVKNVHLCTNLHSYARYRFVALVVMTGFEKAVEPLKT